MKILYIDLDGVVADYDAKKAITTEKQRHECGFFKNLDIFPDAYNAVYKLSGVYNIFFLSTAPWSCISAWSEKREWVEKHFGELAFKKLILSHNKGLLKGDYLIDDRIANGVDGFEGVHIHFGTDKFPDWNSVLEYLM